MNFWTLSEMVKLEDPMLRRPTICGLNSLTQRHDHCVRLLIAYHSVPRPMQYHTPWTTTLIKFPKPLWLTHMETSQSHQPTHFTIHNLMHFPFTHPHHMEHHPHPVIRPPSCNSHIPNQPYTTFKITYTNCNHGDWPVITQFIDSIPILFSQLYQSLNQAIASVSNIILQASKKLHYMEVIENI